MKDLKVVLVDDETLARKKLRELLSVYPNLEIIGEAKNGEEAVEIIEKSDPDLVFLDIQMPGLTGFEVITKLTRKPYIVFQTAYDEYALKAFETSAIDYLLKPVDRERLQLTINKIMGMEQQKSAINGKIDKLLSFLNNGEAEEHLLKYFRIKTGDNIFFVKIEDIVYFEADNKYSILHTKDDNHLINDTLSDLEHKLPPNFIRVHRSFIINMDFLKKLKKWFKSQYVAVMNDQKNTEIPVSKDLKSRLFE